MADHIDLIAPSILPEHVAAGLEALAKTAICAAGTAGDFVTGSDIALGVYPRWPDHPVERLRRRAATAPTDGPFFHTTMTRGYDMPGETFGRDEETVRETSLVAAQAAFCDEDTCAGPFERITA